MIAAPPISAPQVGTNAISAAPPRNTSSVANVTWLGVMLVRASGATLN